jgi:hypothetical protein
MAYTTIDDPGSYFNTVLYTGNNSTLSITGVGFQPDWVWLKRRDSARGHTVYDASRGATYGVYPDLASGQSVGATALTAFNSDGFTVGADDRVSGSGYTYVSWNWKESATAGFDIVTYTGNGTDDTDISHNLSAVPKMIIVKNLDAADDWQIYHAGNTAAPETDYLVLNETADAADRWSDEAPTSSVFTLGDADEVNTDTEDYIAYCFAEKQGYSKFGSFTGNGDADGPFIYTGFQPAYVFYKVTSTTSDWYIQDNKRLTYNVNNTRLEANNTDAEVTGAADSIDMLSNGFKLRWQSASFNASGATYVYAAFAEAPLVNSNGVPCNAR